MSATVTTDVAPLLPEGAAAAAAAEEEIAVLRAILARVDAIQCHVAYLNNTNTSMQQMSWIIHQSQVEWTGVQLLFWIIVVLLLLCIVIFALR